MAAVARRGYMLLYRLDWDGSPYTRFNCGSPALSYQHTGSYLCQIEALTSDNLESLGAIQVESGVAGSNVADGSLSVRYFPPSCFCLPLSAESAVGFRNRAPCFYLGQP